MYFTHQSDSLVAPRKTALVNVEFVRDQEAGIDKVQIVAGSFRYLMASEK